MATDSTKNNKPTDSNPEGDETAEKTSGATKATGAKAVANEPKKTSEEQDQPSLKKAADDEEPEDAGPDADNKDKTASNSKASSDASDASDASDDSDDSEDDSDDDDDDDDDAHGAVGSGARTSGGFAAGSAAVVSAGLGLASLLGTSLGDMLRSRKELIGQIEGSSGTAEQQIDAFYSTPWHTTAAVNGLFALLAVAVGGVLLAVYTQRADSRSWVKSVALGGVILGLLGLLVATGMYFDLFASAPEVPSGPPAT